MNRSVIRVSDIMSHPVVTVPGDASFKSIVERLMGHDIGAVPVVDDAGRLIGIVAEADLISRPAFDREPRRLARLRALLQPRVGAWSRKAAGLSAASLMTTRVHSVAPSDSIQTAAECMMQHEVGRLPVVADDQVVGIVARRDVLRQFHRGDDDIAADVEERINDPFTFESGHDVTFTVHDGMVALAGSVPFPHDVRALTSVVRGIAGVVAVENRARAVMPEPAAAGQLWDRDSVQDFRPM